MEIAMREVPVDRKRKEIHVDINGQEVVWHATFIPLPKKTITAESFFDLVSRKFWGFRTDENSKISLEKFTNHARKEFGPDFIQLFDAKDRLYQIANKLFEDNAKARPRYSGKFFELEEHLSNDDCKILFSIDHHEIIWHARKEYQKTHFKLPVGTDVPFVIYQTNLLNDVAYEFWNGSYDPEDPKALPKFLEKARTIFGDDADELVEIQDELDLIPWKMTHKEFEK